MPLVRFEVRNEYGLGDRELYRGAAKREEPKALLDGVAVAGLVGILRQLGDLAEFAADVFHDLHEQMTATAARGRKVLRRVQNIEAALPTLEKAIQGQKSHIHFAYVAGSDWHAHIRNEQSHLLSTELPRFMMDSYEECRDPPRLYLLDKFDSAGGGACQKRYSDPSYFRRAWSMSKMGKAESFQKEKKIHKTKRKVSRLRSGELLQHVLGASGYNSRPRFTSPSTDGQFFSEHRTNGTHFASSSTDGQSFTENRSTPDMRYNLEVASRSTSFSSKPRLSFVEQVVDTEIDYDILSDAKLHDKHSDASPSVLHDELNGDGSNDDCYQNGSGIGQDVATSSYVTWEEKTEIIKPSSSLSCDDVIIAEVENLETAHMNFEQPDIDHSDKGIQDIDHSDKGILDQQGVLPEIAKAPVSSSAPTHFEEITSETDNYMDALNTLESETEAEAECQTKREVNLLSNPSSEGIQVGTEKMQVQDLQPPDISGSEAINTSHSMLNEHDSGNSSKTVPSDSLEQLLPPHNILNEISGSNDHDGATMTTDECVGDNLSSVTGVCSIVESQTIPTVNISGLSSTKLWTNAGLFGLEPSKPPDFGALNVVQDNPIPESSDSAHDLSSDRVKLKLEAVDIPNGNMSTESNFVGRMDENKPGKQNLASEIDEPIGEPANSIHAYSSGTDLVRKKDVSPIADLPVACNITPEHNDSGGGTKNISSSFSDLAQRFLANTLQRRASLTYASVPSGTVNSDVGNHKVESNGVISQGSFHQTKEKVSHKISKMSISPRSHYSGQSSPPLEHMKFSFLPMNGSETSKLKLEFPNGNLHESADDLMFPTFQLLPRSDFRSAENGCESDDDTFCRSCPYSSEDIVSPRSYSSSELWEQEENSEFEDHNKNEANNGALPFDSSSAMDLPGIDSVMPLNNQQNGNHDPMYNSVSMATQNQDEMPPPPPLPPVQWRLMKPSVDSGEDKNAKTEERFIQSDFPQSPSLTSAQQEGRLAPIAPFFPEPLPPQQLKNMHDVEKLNGHLERNHAAGSKEVKVREELLHQIRNKDQYLQHDQQRLNGHEMPRSYSFNTKNFDERDELLHQIRNKAFNLRRTTTSKPSITSETAPNASVSAILEKANAIRQQAFVGSDEGGDDDNWSDM
ncbi:SCAR-like protein 2 isoform X1 [Ananas comosus]|uniref:Protein SCAR n=1 Tax=Ananas comosus TaxID=4615 RepID=A0A6P5FTA0_ANACO|nr:SCAR-like protein 2 isoform X1 [Ananas comosus]